MTLGIDVGSYQSSVASEQLPWTQLNERKNHILSWVASDQESAIVGDAAQTIAEERGYDQVYTRFLQSSDQQQQGYFIAGQKLQQFDIINFLFKKLQYLSTSQMQEACILATPTVLHRDQQLMLVSSAIKQGFQIKAVISHTFANALALLHRESFKIGDVFAVYDWEDDSFSFSTYRVTHRYSLEILASQTVQQVSLYEVDKRIWFLIAEKYKALRGRELTEEVLSFNDPRLKDCKKNLEKYGKASIELRQYMIDLSFGEFIERTQDLVQQTVHKIDQVLRQSYLSENDLGSRVYFLGTTYLSEVQHHGQSMVEEAKKCFSQAVIEETGLGLAAKGAALFGAYYLDHHPEYRLQFNDQNQQTVLYLDRTLHFYGVVTSVYDPESKTDKDQNLPLIAKGQRLPVQYIQKLHTDEQGQIEVELQFTTAAVKTDQLEHVNLLPVHHIHFAHSAQKLVEVTLNINIDLEHRLSCVLNNSFTGEQTEIDQLDPVFGQYHYWRDPLIAVQ